MSGGPAPHDDKGAPGQPRRIVAVIFDLDGVLLDSEPVWEEERRRFVVEHGGHWRADTQRRLMGMSTKEWGAYLSAELSVRLPPQAVIDGVLQRMERHYERELPLINGAVETVQRLAARWRLGLASSSARFLIDLVLGRARLSAHFAATVSSDEVAHGKPAPDVYLEAARRLGVPPGECAAVEDSANGLRAAAAAGMAVVAVPNQQYPPDADALALADAVVVDLWRLDEETIEMLGARS